MKSTVEVSRRIKAELTQKFKGCKFYVSSRSGRSIRVDWNFGPAYDQVKAVTAKYEAGYFDGMADSYVYVKQADPSIGSVDYLLLSRGFNTVAERTSKDFNAEFYKTETSFQFLLAKDIAAYYKIEWTGPNTQISQGGNDDTYAHNFAYRILVTQAFDTTEVTEYNGIKRIDEEGVTFAGSNLYDKEKRAFVENGETLLYPDFRLTFLVLYNGGKQSQPVKLEEEIASRKEHYEIDKKRKAEYAAREEKINLQVEELKSILNSNASDAVKHLAQIKIYELRHSEVEKDIENLKFKRFELNPAPFIQAEFYSDKFAKLSEFKTELERYKAETPTYKTKTAKIEQVLVMDAVNYALVSNCLFCPLDDVWKKIGGADFDKNIMVTELGYTPAEMAEFEKKAVLHEFTPDELKVFQKYNYIITTLIYNQDTKESFLVDCEGYDYAQTPALPANPEEAAAIAENAIAGVLSMPVKTGMPAAKEFELNLAPKEFFTKIDVNALPASAAEIVEKIRNSEDFKMAADDATMEDLRPLAELLYRDYPEALGISTITPEEEEAKVIQLNTHQAAKTEHAGKVAATAAKLEALKSRAELVQEMLSAKPRNKQLKDRLELVNEMLEAAQKELSELTGNEPKLATGGSLDADPETARLAKELLWETVGEYAAAINYLADNTFEIVWEDETTVDDVTALLQKINEEDLTIGNLSLKAPYDNLGQSGDELKDERSRSITKIRFNVEDTLFALGGFLAGAALGIAGTIGAQKFMQNDAHVTNKPAYNKGDINTADAYIEYEKLYASAKPKWASYPKIIRFYDDGKDIKTRVWEKQDKNGKWATISEQEFDGMNELGYERHKKSEGGKFVYYKPAHPMPPENFLDSHTDEAKQKIEQIIKEKKSIMESGGSCGCQMANGGPLQEAKLIKKDISPYGEVDAFEAIGQDDVIYFAVPVDSQSSAVWQVMKMHADNEPLYFTNALTREEAIELAKVAAETEYQYMKSGGSLSSKNFADTVKEMHEQIASVTLKDGTVIPGKDLMEEGGPVIKNQYVDEDFTPYTPNEVWAAWSESQRSHFLEDHKDKINLQYDRNTNTDLPKKEYNELPDLVKNQLAHHIISGEYAQGGYTYASGGNIPNNYEGKTAEHIWSNWTIDQRSHFLTDHMLHIPELNNHNSFGAAASIKYVNLKYKDLPQSIIDELQIHVAEGQYKKGGTARPDEYQLEYYNEDIGGGLSFDRVFQTKEEALAAEKELKKEGKLTLVTRLKHEDEFEPGTPAVLFSAEYNWVTKKMEILAETGQIVIRDGKKGISLYRNKNYSGDVERIVFPKTWNHVESFFEADERKHKIVNGYDVFSDKTVSELVQEYITEYKYPKPRYVVETDDGYSTAKHYDQALIVAKAAGNATIIDCKTLKTTTVYKGEVEKEEIKMEQGGTAWFKEAVEAHAPDTLNGWHKDEAPATRRKKALSSRDKKDTAHNRYLSVARALQALANVTKDADTKKAAHEDAEYFYAKTVKKEKGGTVLEKRRRRASKKCPVGTQMQSLMFSTKKFSKTKARNWAKKHGFKFDKLDATANFYHFVQEPTKHFAPGSLRTITLTDGIEAHIGCPKL